VKCPAATLVVNKIRRELPGEVGDGSGDIELVDAQSTLTKQFRCFRPIVVEYLRQRPVVGVSIFFVVDWNSTRLIKLRRQQVLHSLERLVEYQRRWRLLRGSES